MSDTVVVMDKRPHPANRHRRIFYNRRKTASWRISSASSISTCMRQGHVVGCFSRKFKCLDKGFAPMERWTCHPARGY